jgi:hypothetical protein
MRNPRDDGRFRRAPPSAVERLEHKAQRYANQEPERRLRRTQAKQTDESTADDSREQRFVGAEDEPQQPPEQRHQEGAAEDAEPEWLDLARAPPDAADRFGRRQQNGTDHGAAADPDPSIAWPTTAPDAAPSTVPQISASSTRLERLRLRRSVSPTPREYRRVVSGRHEG